MKSSVTQYLLTLVMLSCHHIVLADANHENSIMPRVLVDDAKKNGCDQIYNFYDMGGLMSRDNFRPPYAFGYIESMRKSGPSIHEYNPGLSAIYWCQKNKGGKITYQLRLWISDNKYEINRKYFHEIMNGFKCGKLIYENIIPSGLHVSVTKKDIGRFVELVNGKNIDRKVDYSAGVTVIEEFGNDLAENWICQGGKWLHTLSD